MSGTVPVGVAKRPLPVPPLPVSSHVLVVGTPDAATQQFEAALESLAVGVEYRPIPRLLSERRASLDPQDALGQPPRGISSADLTTFLRDLMTKGADAPPLCYVVHDPEAGDERPGAAERSDVVVEVVTALHTLDPHTPILASTGSMVSPAFLQRALDAGADEVVRTEELGVRDLVTKRIQGMLAVVERAVTGRGWAPPGEAPVVAPAPLTGAEQAEVRRRAEAVLAQAPTADAQRRWWSAAGAIPAPELRSTQHRLDASKIAARLAVPLARFCGLATPPMTREGIRQHPDSERLQFGLASIARTLDALDELIPDREAQQQWLRTPQPALNDATPLALLLAGDGMRVVALVGMAREGVIG